MMKKEVVLVTITGLFLLSYVLEAVVNPLNLNLPTPYHYITSHYLTTYPFTTAIIVIRAIGIFLTPLLFMSFFDDHHSAKGASLLVIIALMQLYSLQDIATKASVVPLEWALAISVGGVALVIPMIWYFFVGGLSWLHRSLGGGETPSQEEDTYESDEEDEE